VGRNTTDTLTNKTVTGLLGTATLLNNVRFADQFCSVAGTYNETCINNAITDIAGASGALKITRAFTLNSSVTVPSNVVLEFDGGSLNPAAGTTLTINGPFHASPIDFIFGGSGTVVISRSDEVYVQWFGAKGNGTTDDTAAIQAALTAGCNGAVPGIVFVPLGNYLVSGLTLPSNCRMTGSGTFVYTSGNKSISVGSNTQIDHLSFNGANNIGAAILSQSGASMIRVGPDNHFSGFTNGAICFSTACGSLATPPSNILIDHNYFQNNETGANPPIFNVQCGDNVSGFDVEYNTFVGDGDFDIGIDGCQDVRILGNTIIRGTNGLAGAIQIEATSFSISGVIVKNNIVTSPHFANSYPACGIEMHTNGNGGSGSGANKLTNFMVEGNFVTGAPGGGICLFYTTNDTTTPGVIHGNVTVSNSGAGLNIQGGQVVIDSNYSSGNTGNGISIACIMQPCQLTGNTATGNTGVGLAIGGSPWLAVTGNGTNNFDSNTAGTVYKGSAFNQNTIY
jgi:hypothetical protein